MEGDQVVAPFGLELPGNSSSSPDYPARHVRLAAAPPYDVIDLVVDIELRGRRPR